MPDPLDDSAPFNDDQGTRMARESRPTGAGAEASEGIHGSPGGRSRDREEDEQTSLEDRPDADDDRPGSEPLPDSEQHRSRYGGGGARGGPGV